MSKITKLPPLANKEDKLEEVYAGLDELKNQLFEVVDEYEQEDSDSSVMDRLTEALDALEDACDAINDVLMEA